MGLAGSANVNYALSELFELADRQWHTYELLEESVKEKVEKYLKSVVDFEDEEIMDYILCIIPRIGLSNLFSYILQNKYVMIINEIESAWHSGRKRGPFRHERYS